MVIAKVKKLCLEHAVFIYILIMTVAIMTIGHFSVLDGVVKMGSKLKDSSNFSEHSNHINRETTDLSLANSEEMLLKEIEDNLGIDKMESPVENYTKHPCSSNSDCERFQHCLKSWPEEKPKAAIYTFCSKPDKLQRWLKNLYENFLEAFQYPVIVFHERSITEQLYQIQQDKKQYPLYLQEVDLSVPDKFYNVPLAECYTGESERSLSRFHSFLVHEHPIMDHLDYYWRLDMNSKVLCPIKFDVFELMREGNYIHGYISKQQTSGICVHYLWDKVYGLAASDPDLDLQRLHQWPDRTHLFHSFQISAMRLWRSPGYKRFVTSLDRSGGFYRFGWPDSQVMSLGIALFTEPDDVVFLDKIGIRVGKVTNVGECEATVDLKSEINDATTTISTTNY